MHDPASPPRRAEIWQVDLDPTVGHEQAKRRPCVIVSVDQLNQSGAELCIVVPITSTDRRIRTHVALHGNPGLDRPSWALVEQVRVVSRLRLIRILGRVDSRAMANIERVLASLLGIDADTSSSNPRR
jgi:mRNA interferase MazF